MKRRAIVSLMSTTGGLVRAMSCSVNESPANPRNICIDSQVRRCHPEMIGVRGKRPVIRGSVPSKRISHIGHTGQWGRPSRFRPHRCQARSSMNRAGGPQTGLAETAHDLTVRSATSGHREHVLRIEPEWHVEQPPQAPEEQPGPNEEDNGQGHFSDDERAANPAPLPRAPRPGRLPSAHHTDSVGTPEGPERVRDEHPGANRQRPA